MIDKPFISIIVPIYGVEKYLPKCLDSILKQNFSNYELILVDDGSEPRKDSPACSAEASCYDICEEYAAKDSRIRVIHKENGGLVSARKAGLKIATGEYVSYIDPDDWVDEDFLQNYIDEVLKYSANYGENPDIVMQGFYYEFEDGSNQRYECKAGSGIFEGESLASLRENMLYDGENFFEPYVAPSVWNKLFKRELLETIQYEINEEITIGEDVVVTFPLLLQAKSFVIVNEKASYHYLVRTSSMTFDIDVKLFRKMSLMVGFLQEIGRKYSDTNFLYQSEVYGAFIAEQMLDRVIYAGKLTEINKKVKVLEEGYPLFDIDGLVPDGEMDELNLPEVTARKIQYIKARQWKRLLIYAYKTKIYARLKA